MAFSALRSWCDRVEERQIIRGMKIVEGEETGRGGLGGWRECRDGRSGARVLRAIGVSQRKEEVVQSWLLAQGSRQTPQ